MWGFSVICQKLMFGCILDEVWAPPLCLRLESRSKVSMVTRPSGVTEPGPGSWVGTGRGTAGIRLDTNVLHSIE